MGLGRVKTVFKGGRHREPGAEGLLNRLAEKLVECAIEDKQAWAFQQIVDRLEGKAAQQFDHNVIDNREISEYSDAELTAILRRRVGVVPVESDEERPLGGALN